MELINLTPHTITLRDASGIDHVIPTSGTVARVASTPGTPSTVEGIPVQVYSPQTWGEVMGLPGPQRNAIYIVSGLVAGRVNRADVVSPGTGPNDGAIRNEAGQVVAVTRLNLAG